MKNPIIFLALLLSGGMFVNAQDCSRYYPMKEGVTMVYTSYDKKGKDSGSIRYHVQEATSSGDMTKATMNMTLVDEKGREVVNSDYTLTCTGNSVHIDYESLLSNEMLEQFGEMEMDISGTDIEIPNDLSVGQSLPDASVHMKMSMSGINMNMNMESVNRKVEKQENVTTPAGSYDCFVIYSETNSKMMMANNTFPSRIWLSEGVGMVKQETYDKKGNTIGSMVLTSFEK